MWDLVDIKIFFSFPATFFLGKLWISCTIKKDTHPKLQPRLHNAYRHLKSTWDIRS